MCSWSGGSLVFGTGVESASVGLLDFLRAVCSSVEREKIKRWGELGRLLASVQWILGWDSWLVFSFASIPAQLIGIHLTKQYICKVA